MPQQSTGWKLVPHAPVPHHVLGVSWGGKLALALKRFAHQRVRSLTVIAPGLFPRVDLPLADKLRVGLNVLAGGQSLFNIPLNEPELFTANPQRLVFIAEDPLRLRQVTARFLLASRRLDRYVLARRKRPTPCRLRVFLAGHDRIIDNHRTKDFIRRLDWPGREITEYPDAHHTLEFEPTPELFFHDLVAWLGNQQ